MASSVAGAVRPRASAASRANRPAGVRRERTAYAMAESRIAAPTRLPAAMSTDGDPKGCQISRAPTVSVASTT